jgi:FtsZ-binding cell division protein ZapB
MAALRNLALVAKEKLRRNEGEAVDLSTAVVGLPLWQLDVVELTGHNIEARGREEVNQLLRQGWRLLHIYTLKYQEDGVWRERPMAILGRLRNVEESRKIPTAGWRDR